MTLDLNDETVLLLTNIPQKYMEHTLVTAYASVDGNSVTMLEDNGSSNAEAPLTVVNTRGFDLPQTGDHGTWMYGVIGITMMAGALVVMMIAFKKKEKEQPVQE